MLIEPVHIFVPKGRSALRISSRNRSPATFLVRCWAKLAPTKTAKIWSSPSVEQRPDRGETLVDRFALDGIDSYWLAILVFQYSDDHWTRAPVLGEAMETIPVHGLAFADSRVALDDPAREAAVLVDVDYVQ